jgi:hypothetical protein
MTRAQVDTLLDDDPVIREETDDSDLSADFEELFGIYLEDPDGLIGGSPVADLGFDELRYYSEYIRADNSLRIVRA